MGKCMLNRKRQQCKRPQWPVCVCVCKQLSITSLPLFCPLFLAFSCCSTTNSLHFAFAFVSLLCAVLKEPLPAFRLRRVKQFTVDGWIHQFGCIDFLRSSSTSSSSFAFHVLSANLHKLLLDVKARKGMWAERGRRKVSRLYKVLMQRK